METETATAAPEAPPPERTDASGQVLRAIVTVHLALAFGQAVLAGVFLNGDYDGLAMHAFNADLVYSAGLAQLAAAVAVGLRTRLWWPLAATTGILLAETLQYFAGEYAWLWIHLPLGTAVIAGLAGQFAAVWKRPLPRRAAEARR